MCLESSIPIPESNDCHCVGDGCCGPLVFGGTWWWKGGRTMVEGRKNEGRKKQRINENQHDHVICSRFQKIAE